MFRIAMLFSCVVACSAYAVLPLAHPVPAVHTSVAAPLAPFVHGFAGHGLLGLRGYDLLGHGYGFKSYGHHLLKRSPHLVAPVVGHYGQVGYVDPLAAVVPVAVSHQTRVDVHSSPAVVPVPILPVVKPVEAPLIHAAPLLHKPAISPLAYGVGHYGSVYSHLGHY